MSIALTKEAAPAVVADDVAIYTDTADKRVKAKDEYGGIRQLGDHGLRSINVVRNGDFGIAQRQVIGTLTSYAGGTGRAFAADRWGMTVQTSSAQFAGISTDSLITGLNSRWYGQFKQISGVGKLIVSQVVESNNGGHLRGATVRMQFKARHVATQNNLRFAVLQNTSAATVDAIAAAFEAAFGANGTDPTWGTNLSVVAPLSAEGLDNATVANGACTAALTTTFQRFGACFTLPTDYKNIIVVFWTNNQMAVNDEIHISEAGLYLGDEIRDWTPRDETEELLCCLRYYEKTFPLLVAPAQSAGVTGALHFATGLAAGSTVAHGSWRYKVKKRATPGTVVFYNPSAANAFVRNLSLGTDSSVTSAANADAESLDITFTSPASTVVGHTMIVHITADAEI